MPRKSKSKRSVADTRGIPFGMDPYIFYEYKANLIAASSVGVEWLVYRLFGPRVVMSVVFAIDPFSATKLSKVAISPKNRVRNLVRTSILDEIKLASDVDTTTTSTDKRKGTSIVWRDHTTGLSTQSVNSMNSTALVNDTSARTRGRGSDYGEAEFHFLDFYAPSWLLSYRHTVVSDTSIARGEVLTTRRHSFNRFLTVSRNAANMLRDGNLALARSELESQKYLLVARALPTSRDFSISRSIAELKDVPRSISTLRESILRLSSVYKSLPSGSLRDKVFSLKDTAAQIPSEYLSFHFGWKQLYSDAMSVLTKPEVVNRKINRLIERNGKVSTYTSTMKYSKGRSLNLSSYFTNGTSSLLGSVTKSTQTTDEFSLRCSLQAKFEFPPAMELLFREDLFARKLGVIPTPLDLYNLMPWSWLIDWFSGLGQYLTLIEGINSDPSLINFGFASLNMTTTINVTADARQILSQESMSSDGHTPSTNDIYHRATYGAVAVCKTYIRRDVSTLASLRSASAGVNLSSFQQSIIGALLAQKAKL